MPTYMVHWKLYPERSPLLDGKARAERLFAEQVARRLGGELLTYHHAIGGRSSAAMIRLPEVAVGLVDAIARASGDAARDIVVTQMKSLSRAA